MNGNERSTGPVLNRASRRTFPPMAGRRVRSGDRSPGPATERPPEGVNHHPLVAGRDRALPGGRSRMADAHRRGPSRMDRETLRRLNARRRRAVQRAGRCQGRRRHGRAQKCGRVNTTGLPAGSYPGERRLRPIVVAPALVEEVAHGADTLHSVAAPRVGELGLPQHRQLLVGQPPTGVGRRRPVLELHTRRDRRTGPCGPCPEPGACPRPRRSPAAGRGQRRQDDQGERRCGGRRPAAPGQPLDGIQNLDEAFPLASRQPLALVGGRSSNERVQLDEPFQVAAFLAFARRMACSHLPAPRQLRSASAGIRAASNVSAASSSRPSTSCGRARRARSGGSTASRP